MAARDTTLYKYLFEALKAQTRAHRNGRSLNHYSAFGYSLPYDKIYKWSRRVLPQFYSRQFPNTPEGNIEFATKITEDFEVKSVTNDLLADYRQALEGKPVLDEPDKIHQEFQQDLKEEQDRQKREETIQPSGIKLEPEQKPSLAEQTKFKAAQARQAVERSALPRVSQNLLSKFSILTRTLWSRYSPVILGGMGGGMAGFLSYGKVGAILGVVGGATLGYKLSQSQSESDYQQQPPLGVTQIGRRFMGNPNSAIGRRMLSGAGRELGSLGASGGRVAALGGRAAIAFLATPAGWITLGVILALILVLVLFRFFHLDRTTSLLPPFGQQTENLTELNEVGPQQAVYVTKSGPNSVDNNTSFTYEIDVTYTGKGQANVQVTDNLPSQLAYSSCTDNCTQSGNSVIWQLTQLPQNQPKKLFLTVNPTSSDFYAVNSAEANITSTTGATGPGVGQSSDFLSLMRTQGRNVNIIADNADDFANRIITNAQSTNLSTLTNQPDRLKQIFQAASAANVNPLAVLAIWGVEAGFDINDTEFGCQPFGNGFGAQLNCSVNTLNYWINFFDQNNTNGVYQLNPACLYSDSFVFAYEKYTPVCAINDGNDNARTNFINFYTNLGK